VLWKQSSAEEPGWDSPWGRGRPGWHIECSVMSKAHLGEVFDIHGGGLDLIFPHHENEIAQSRCAHGSTVMANYWMHNGFLQVEGQKMSKSLGNFVTIADVLRDWPGEVARFNMLRTHYRQPIDWTRDSLEESSRILQNWKNLADGQSNGLPDAIVEPLSDDLNCHMAFVAMARMASEGDAASLGAALSLIGFSLETRETASVDRETVVRLVEDRLLARHNKNWKESDRIRDELAGLGIAIKDNKDGTTTWEVKR
jgi:cysteinyl-tRNA synthetase